MLVKLSNKVLGNGARILTMLLWHDIWTVEEPLECKDDTVRTLSYAAVLGMLGIDDK